jgi:cytochrome c oxidase assembly protein subunit 15
MLAAFVGVVVVALAAAAYRARRHPGGTGAGSPFRLVLLALPLLALVGLLGRATVMLELPPTTVIAHLSTAMALIALLIVIGLRASRLATGGDAPSHPPSWKATLAAIGLTAATLLMGGLTANFEAAGACMGFPLCNGQVWPTAGPGGLTHIHWMHRVLAYALTLHLIGMAVVARKRHAPAGVQRTLWVALGITVLQVVVGAAMILSILQPQWRALHVAAGTAVWVCVVVLAWAVKPVRSERAAVIGGNARIEKATAVSSES